MGYYGFAPYVPVEKRRRQAEHEVKRLRKQGKTVEPVVIEGQKIASTFWGKEWCQNMESYRDYESRLPRGRSYARHGSIVDLKIEEGLVSALVNGSSLYRVTITIGRMPEKAWKDVCTDCAGGIDSMIELLQGRFAKNVMERLCRQAGGLFPRPSEIKFTCSCPDHATMCKHVAAALYGVGARLDHKPELLFRLRAVKETDLLNQIGPALPMSGKPIQTGKMLEVDDMSALFGIELVTDLPEMAAPISPKKPAPKVKTAPEKNSPPPRVPVAAKATKTQPVRKIVTATRAPVVSQGTAAAKPKMTVVSPPVRRKVVPVVSSASSTRLAKAKAAPAIKKTIAAKPALAKTRPIANVKHVEKAKPKETKVPLLNPKLLSARKPVQTTRKIRQPTRR